MTMRVRILTAVVAALTVVASVQTILAQEVAGSSHAVITPFQDLHNDASLDGSLHLANQRFIILMYQNAVAVYSEATFTNVSGDTLHTELALPSHGYRVSMDGSAVYNSNLYGPRVWVAGDRLQVTTEETDEAEWYTVRPVFAPGQIKTLKALYWVPTEIDAIDAEPPSDSGAIAPGKRHWQIRLSDANGWQGMIGNVDVHVIVKDGLAEELSAIRLRPKSYESKDSVLTWSFSNIKPGESQNIHCAFDTPVRGKSGTLVPSELNTLPELAGELTKGGYDELLRLADKQ